MESVLEDEITSINAIYEADTLSPTTVPSELVLKIPNSHVSLRLAFPKDYPDASPTVLGPHSIGDETRKGEAHVLVELTKSSIQEVFIQGEPCIYDLLEALANRPERQDPDPKAGIGSSNPLGEAARANDNSSAFDGFQALLALDPPWTLSVVQTEKKSIFVARAAPVSNPALAKSYIQHLLLTDKKAAKATHNITAWRIRGGGASAADITYQDCDDDGETAAGGRLLHLLQIMDVWDVVVVVSRWYGGVQLGPDRFRIINAVARDALVRGGWVEGGDDKEKKKAHR